MITKVKMMQSKTLISNRSLLYAIIFFLFTLITFQPGLMSSDSFLQYDQAVNSNFTDIHPPIMAIWWSLLTVIYEAPITLLIFHLLMLSFALYLLAKNFKNNYIFLIGLMPFTINFVGVLWKDVGLAFSWLLALSILISVKNTKLRRFLFLLFIFYGSAVRPNALAALLPILLYFYYSEYKWSIVKSGFFTILTVVSFVLINNLIAFKVFDTKKLYIGPKIIMIHDISGISKMTNYNYFPVDVNDKYNVEKVIEKYNPSHVLSVIGLEKNMFHYKNFDKSELFKSWTKAVLENPKIYILLRLEHFKSLLRIGIPNGSYTWQNIMKEKYQDIGIIYEKDIKYKIMRKYVDVFHKTFLFSGWFWLLASFILILLWKINTLSAIMGLSSVLYILPYIFIGQAPDFRYIYLSIFLVLLGFILLIYPNLSQRNKYVK